MSDLEAQIEAIIAKADNQQAAIAFRTVAHGLAVFMLELIDNGLPREEAMQLTVEMARKLN